MSTDLETLRGALRARAEVDTDAEALLARIGPAYRRRRSRRLLGAAIATVAAVAVVAVLVPRLLFGGYALPAPPSVAIGSPDAAAIGGDPQMIHFDVGQFPYRVINTTWAVQDGVEQLSMWGSTASNPNAQAREYFVDLTLMPVTVTPSPNSTAAPQPPQQLHSTPGTVAGHPAVIATGEGVTHVTWQPIAGVRADLSVRGAVSSTKSLAFAATLTLDRGHPCIPSYFPTVLPAGGHLTGCSISPMSGNGEYVIRGTGGTITVEMFPRPFAAGVTQGATSTPSPAAPLPTLANGWLYELLDPSMNTQHWTAVIRVPDPYVEVFAQGTYGLPDVLLVGGGLQPS